MTLDIYFDLNRVLSSLFFLFENLDHLALNIHERLKVNQQQYL